MTRNATVMLIIVLSILGVWVAGYLTWFAFTAPVGSCPIGGYGFISCSGVLASSYARIAGIPTALIGLVWFIVALLLGLLMLRSGTVLRYLLAWALIGLVGVVALVGIELFIIQQLCIFCTIAHILGIGILGLTLKLWMQGR